MRRPLAAGARSALAAPVTLAALAVVTLGCTHSPAHPAAADGGSALPAPSLPDADDVSLDPADAGYHVVCPKQAPFDLDAPGIKDQCTRPIYLVGSNFSRVFTSPDAVHWTLAATLAGSDRVYQRVHEFASGLGFLVNLSDNALAISTDGTTWTSVGSGWPYNSALTFAAQTFVEYGGGTDYSGDGVHWYATPGSNNFTNGVPANYSPADMTWFNGSFYAVGDHDPGNMMPKQPAYRSSSDGGKTWSNDVVVATVADSLCGAAASAGALVVVGSSGFAAVTSDGKTWTTLPALAADGGLAGVLWDGQRFIALGNNHFFVSTDGQSWTASANGNHLSRLAAVDVGYLGYNDKTLYLSPDLATWTSVFTNDASLWSIGSGRVLKK